MQITKSLFETLQNGQEVFIYELQNDNEIRVKITNYGGIITHIFTPDKQGVAEDIVMGFDTLEEYLGGHPYFGAICGRVANRIAGGKFTLNGEEYKLLINNGPNHLHGGGEGFDKKVWTPFAEKTGNAVTLKLGYTSPHMEEGYPGNLMVEVSYSLNNENELIIDYRARTDQDTILNLTNHSYFNLNMKAGNILDHYLFLDCSTYTPFDRYSIPTGEILPVKGSPYDFTMQKTIGQDFHKLENGYDNNFVLNKEEGKFKWFAKVVEKQSGRVLEAGTTEPGVQLYTANYVNAIKAKQGRVYGPQDAFCLEAQHFPDSPNKPHFPSVMLRKGSEYTQRTSYKFSIEKL